MHTSFINIESFRVCMKKPTKRQLIATYQQLQIEIQKSDPNNKTTQRQLAEKVWMLLTLYLEVKTQTDAGNHKSLDECKRKVAKEDPTIHHIYQIGRLCHKYHYSPWSDGEGDNTIAESAGIVSNYVESRMESLQ